MCLEFIGEAHFINDIQPVRNQTDAVLSAVFADCDSVVCGVERIYEHRLSECAETLALTDGVVDDSVVNAENIAVGVNEIALG